MIFLVLLGVVAVYALIAAIVFHSTIALDLTGASAGFILGWLARYWRPKRRWLGWLPWAFASLALVLALSLLLSAPSTDFDHGVNNKWFDGLSRLLGAQLTDFCTAVGSTFVVGYLWLQYAEHAYMRTVQENEQKMREAAFIRKWLQGDILRKIQSIGPGDSFSKEASPQDCLLLKDFFLQMRAQGWRVDYWEFSFDGIPELILWQGVTLTAPESPEDFKNSLDQLHSQFGQVERE